MLFYFKYVSGIEKHTVFSKARGNKNNPEFCRKVFVSQKGSPEVKCAGYQVRQQILSE